MAASAKRTPFNPAGPFLAKKNFSIFETDLAPGEVYDADVFVRMHERRVEQLFDAHYIDMAVPDDKRAKHLAQLPGADPLDRDGDGGKGGSLTDAEKAALKQAGLSLATWLKLPEPERTDALAEALRAAPASPPPETGAGGNTGGGGGEGAAGAAAAVVGPVVEYKHTGFGRWFAFDAAGNKVGNKVSKSEAEGLAAAAGVPLHGILS